MTNSTLDWIAREVMGWRRKHIDHLGRDAWINRLGEVVLWCEKFLPHENLQQAHDAAEAACEKWGVRFTIDMSYFAHEVRVLYGVDMDSVSVAISRQKPTLPEAIVAVLEELKGVVGDG